MSRHERICSESLVLRNKQEKAFVYLREGCEKAFRSQDARSKHMLANHDFIPKPCPHGCDDGKLYLIYRQFHGHMKIKYIDQASRIYPTVYLFLACRLINLTPSKEYDNVISLNTYLRNVYNLTIFNDRLLYLFRAKPKFI